MAKKSFKSINTKVRLFGGGSIEFNLEGAATDDYLDRLNIVRTNAEDMSPVFQRWGAYMQGSIAENFRAEGRPRKWQELAPATVRERIRLGFGASPILQRTRRLKRGFRTPFSKTFLKIQNNVPYFKFHQQDRGPGKRIIPRRIMVLVQERDLMVFSHLMREHLGFE